MNINILTIFPEIFEVLNSGVLSKAVKNKIISFDALDIRKNASNKAQSYRFKTIWGWRGNGYERRTNC
jgi:tRNA (guanine-N1)-methyltransferase